MWGGIQLSNYMYQVSIIDPDEGGGGQVGLHMPHVLRRNAGLGQLISGARDWMEGTPGYTRQRWQEEP